MIRFVALICLLFSLAFGADMAKGATRTCVSGNMSVAANWGGTLPAAGDNIQINGACVVDASFSNLAYGTLTVQSAASISWPVGGVNTLNVTTVATGSGTGTINMTNGGTLQIRTSWTSINTNLTAGTGTVNWNNNATLPTIGTYNNLTITAGGGTAKLGVATTITGNLLLSTGTLDVTNANLALNVQGNFTNNGTSFIARNGTVTLNGVATQTIGGTTATTFYNLTINNSGTGVVLGTSATVSNSLALTAGVVNTGGNTLTLSANCSAASPSGSSTSFVEGLLKLTFNAGSQTCTFPVGDATTALYAPITIAFTGSGGGTLTGSTSPDTGNTEQSAASFDTTASAKRYWTLTAGTLVSFTNYSVTFQFNNPADLDASAQPANFFVKSFTGGNWITPALGIVNSTSTQATGITQTGFGIFVVGVLGSSCNPPIGAPAGLSCQCDNFGRANSALSPSTIFGGTWFLDSSSGPAGFPQIAYPGYLRLTDNQGNESNSASVPGIFPASGNYISVEFKHYAYNSTTPAAGADGMSVILSDYSQPPTPGAFGGSLGFAQKTGINGFNYGWVGIALDEFGNYANATEGRGSGPGAAPQSVGIRGSGSGSGNGATNYPWLKGDLDLCGGSQASCAAGIDNAVATTPSRGYLYQVIVDARNYTSGTPTTLVSVNRDTTGTGASYSSLIAPFDVYVTNPSQSVVPQNWQLTFAGSTGGDTNIHEIGGLKICASSMFAPTQNSASGFNAIDSSLSNSKASVLSGHIFMKVAGAPFALNVAALQTPATNGLNAVYAASGNKTVTLKLFDDSAGATCSTPASACSACAKTVVASQTMTFTAADAGFKKSANITIDGGYTRLIAQMSDGPTTGCSTDAFSVRPAYYVLSTAAFAGGKLNAGAPFNITATPKDVNTSTLAIGSTGTPSLSAVTDPQVTVGATVIHTLTENSWTTAAASGSFSFFDVGNFSLPANTIYDSQFGNVLGQAQDQTSGDCNSGSGSPYVPNVCYSYNGSTCNATPATPWSPDSSGKYGCDVGTLALNGIGRFYPDHYEAQIVLTPADTASAYTYMRQPFTLTNTALTTPVQVKALAKGQFFSMNPTYGLPSFSTGYGTLSTLWFGAQNGAAPATDLINCIPASATPNSSVNRCTATILPTTGSRSNAWTNGIYAAPASSFAFDPPKDTTYATPDATWGPYDTLNVGVTVSDPDATASPPTGMLTISGSSFILNGATYQAASQNLSGGIISGTTKMRFGRMRLFNTWGSDNALNMAIPLQVQYWNGQSWGLNSLQNAIPGLTSSIALSNQTGALTPANMGAGNVSSASVQAGGSGSILLKCPHASCPPATWSPITGSVDVAINLGVGSGTTDTACLAGQPLTTGAGLPWLRSTFGSCSPTFNSDPYGLMSFGIASPETNRTVNIRELF